MYLAGGLHWNNLYEAQKKWLTKGGQFAPETGGQYHRIIHRKFKNWYKKFITMLENLKGYI